MSLNHPELVHKHFTLFSLCAGVFRVGSMMFDVLDPFRSSA